jgi:hypothetical protein
MKNLKKIQNNVVLLVSILSIIDTFKQEVNEEIIMISGEDYSSSHEYLVEKINEIESEAGTKKILLNALIKAEITKKGVMNKKSEAVIKKAYELFEIEVLGLEVKTLDKKVKTLNPKESEMPETTSEKLAAVKEYMEKIILYLTEYNTQARSTGLGYSTTVGIRNNLNRINLRLKRI